MTDEQIKRLAKRIADYLFVNGAWQQGTRLVLVREDESGDMKQNLGGYSHRGAVISIEVALAAALKEQTP